MIKAVNLLDRVMFGALLVFIIFIPYSAAATQAGLFILILAWLAKHYFIWKSHPSQGLLKSYTTPSYGLHWPLIVIALLIVFTIPFSQAPALSLKKFFSRFIQQIFLMYCVAEIINTPKRLYQVMAMFLWTLLVVNADIAVQYFRGHSFIFSNELLFQRVSGPMRHPNDLGTLLVTVIPIILSLMITRRFWMPLIFKPKALIVILTVLGWVLFASSVTALGLSVSRGAWVAFAITMIGYGCYLKNTRLTVGILLILTLFFWVFWVNCMNVRTDISVRARTNIFKNTDTNTTDIVNHMDKTKTSTEKDLSNEKVLFNYSSRDVYWKAAIDIMKDRPLTGCGYNAYIQKLKTMQVGHEEYPHNSLLHIGAELGIIGLLAYFWFFIALLLTVMKTLKEISFSKDLYKLGVGLCFGILAWLIHSLLDTPWESLLLNILWWTLIGVLLSLGNIAQHIKASQKGVV
jgi:O-antigen ligase